VLVRLSTSGINPSDYKKRAVNAPLEFPRIVPHFDGAGVVEALGAGVIDCKVGDRVWTFNAQFKRAMGTAAQYIALPAALVRPLPSNTGFVGQYDSGFQVHRCNTRDQRSLLQSEAFNIIIIATWLSKFPQKTRAQWEKSDQNDRRGSEDRQNE
jgi:hypothetical protein